MSTIIRKLGQQEQLNFLLTNRIPRRFATQLMGRISRIKSPLFTRLVLATWRRFADELDLNESKKQTFNSLHDCFIRELKEGARPIDSRTDIITSPSDGIIGSFGKIKNMQAFQAKGYPYELSELIPDRSIREKYRDGHYITLRLKSTMYHRFHSPINCRVTQVNYLSGDTWNVNPIALKRIKSLYCKNERAIIDLELQDKSKHIALVPVAAILVASMKFHCIPETLDLKYKGANKISCDASYLKGQEMGYFQHGSTIIIFATKNYKFHSNICEGATIRMGEPLLQDS